MKFFESVQQAPPDAIFGLNQSYASDPRAAKVNLGAGVYKTADLKPFILKTVKKAEARILDQEDSKDYLSIDGLPKFVHLTKSLVFGPHDGSHIYGAQTTGGTSALRVGGGFFKEWGFETVYLSDPTWDNHQRVFSHAGLNVKFYPYFKEESRGFDCEGMLAAIDQMEKSSVILLQACCHNPTGIDPTLPEWKTIFKKLREKQIIPFFDFAYQGFGESLELDAEALRLFVASGLECAVAVSYAKNFGLYAERCGALFMVCHTAEEAARVGSQIKVIIRGLYSNPPCHGARIVAEILGDTHLKHEWKAELASMRSRISTMRQMLTEGLGFDFLAAQKGMFSYTGLNAIQVGQLKEDYGIYMPRDGRINVAGLNADNLNYVIKAILQVVR